MSDKECILPAQGVMCPAVNIVFLSWVHFFMHGGLLGTLLPFVTSSLPSLLMANWKVRRRPFMPSRHASLSANIAQT